MDSSANRVPIPSYPIATKYRPEVYKAFSDLIASPEIYGIGANVRDIEILRLACIEKICRDNSPAATGAGFRVSFSAHIWADWADGYVHFWDEGLGPGWNLLVNDDSPALLLRRVLFHVPVPCVFAFFKIPARLPGFDCDIQDDYSICRYNAKALPLSPEEKDIWNKTAKNAAAATAYDLDTPIVWSD